MSIPEAGDSCESTPPPSPHALEPIVVAFLYSSNGMGSWCWEAAHALQELGRSVLLVAAPDTPLPGIPAVEVVRIKLQGRSGKQRSGIAKTVSTAAHLLGAGPDGSLNQIHRYLNARGVKPAAYLLNQSTIVDRSVNCPQVVAAWSYPVDLFAYLRKIPFMVSDRSATSFVRSALSSTGWWRKDWRAYRTADRVLPVTQALLKSLRRRSICAHLAYPGTSVGRVPDRNGRGIRLLMAAVSLGESRKRIRWMLEAMKEMRPPLGTILQLAGEPDDSIRGAAGDIGFPVEFLGHLRRQELQQVMRKAHIFCFGSLSDDWGYVLVEAMANGLVPVAPAMCPFDEILGGVGSCYRPYSQDDFVQVLESVMSTALVEKGRQAWDRAHVCFSRPAFGRSILASLESGPHS